MNLTRLKRSLIHVPWPIFTSIVIAAIGLLLTSIWNPGYASLSLSSGSLACILGGLSLWSWIGLKTLQEQQTVRNYECRPLASRNPADGEIVGWFHRTKVKKKGDLGWVVINGMIFVVGIVFVAVLLRTEYFENKSDLIYASSIFLYFFACVVNPAYYIVGVK